MSPRPAPEAIRVTVPPLALVAVTELPTTAVALERGNGETGDAVASQRAGADRGRAEVVGQDVADDARLRAGLAGRVADLEKRVAGRR